MASDAERRRQERIQAIAAEEELDMFGDLDVEETSAPKEQEQVANAHKSPLLLLLLIKTPEFPLEAGQSLFINTTSKSRDPLEELTILPDGRIQTRLGVYGGLATAITPLQPATYAGRKKSSSNGWKVARIQGLKPGTYVNLERVFEDNWRRLGIPAETLVSPAALAEHALQRGYITPEQAEQYKKADPDAPKTTKKRKAGK